MQCVNCSTQNRPTAKFCSECGTKLEALCPGCRASVSPGAKFCDECGTSLPATTSQTAPAELPAAEASDPPAAPLPGSDGVEWRHLTVMFCDLVDSTELMRTLDVEDLRELTRAYQQMCATIVANLDGFVARYMGDGVLVYFGYPKAHEDDAARAVRAGLEMIAALPRLNAKLGTDKGVELAIRVGLATGRVVAGDLVGEGASKEMVVLGETPNLAARLEAIAEPNTVVIAPSTLRLLRGQIEIEDKGFHDLKGFPDPVAVTRVLRLLDSESRFDAAKAGRHLTPLVGRSDEMALLTRRWEQARSGEGQVVLLSGEAGIGKSRLLQGLVDSIDLGSGARWQLQCSSQHTNSALYPVIKQIERAAGFTQGDTPQRQLDKIRAILPADAEQLELTIQLFAGLLSIPCDDSLLADMSPQRRKDKTLQVLVNLIHTFATGAPSLMTFEDVHWVDPTTLELLDLFVDSVQTVPILVLITFRPEYSPSWVGQPNVTLQALNRLSAREGAQMVAQLVRDSGLPEDAIKQIIDKTDGVPLFVEELTLLLLESDRDAPSKRIEIPNTLQDSLTARLDQLGSAKELMQIGSAIGREFDYDLLRAVAPWEDGDLRIKLQRLGDLLHARGVAPRVRYAFKHALMQEAAYTSLLKSTRQQYHARIAQMLESKFEGICETQPELLAHHFTEAQLNDRAVEWWLRAGRRALAHSTNSEAIAHLQLGLRVLRQLPDDEQTRKLELGIQTSLGPALCATLGYAAPQVQQAYARGRELCAQLGSAPELFSVQWGLWAYHVVRANLDMALESGREMEWLADTANDKDWRIEAALTVGLTRYFLAEPSAAIEDLQRAIELDNRDRDRAFTQLSGQDAVVCALTYAGLTLWMLGRFDEALARSREAIALARALDHPFSLAYALNFGAWLCCMLREPEQVAALADEQIALSEKYGFFWSTLGQVSRGWARAQAGETSDGLAEIRVGISSYQALGARLSETLLLGLEAETCLLAGDVETGSKRVAEGLACAEVTGERMWLAELYRLKAKLYLVGGDDRSLRHDVKDGPNHDQGQVDNVSDSGAAEACLRTAIDHAREHHAPGLELRAVIDLAHLLGDDGRAAQAHTLLAAANAAVSAEARFVDVEQANALLAQLAESMQQSAH